MVTFWSMSRRWPTRSKWKSRTKGLSRFITLPPYRNIINEALIWKVVFQMSYGLLMAHDKGIVHADIKPQNIFLTNEGIKLGDYGLANRLRPDGQLLLDPAGTEDYEAPVRKRWVDRMPLF